MENLCGKTSPISTVRQNPFSFSMSCPLKLCHVALLSPPYGILTYACPEFFPQNFWQIGMRTAVPLGNGAVRAGVITALDAEKEGDFQIRPLTFPMEHKSMLNAAYMDMVGQLAKKQFVSTGRILGSVLPSNLKSTKNIRLRIFHGTQKPRLLKLQDIPKLAPEEQKHLAEAFLNGTAQILEIAEDTALTEKICLLADPPWNIRANASKQREILDFLADSGSIVRHAFQQKFPNHGDALNTLVKNNMVGIMALEQEEKLSEDFLPPPMPVFPLNAKQQEIFDSLAPALAKDSAKSQTALLFGVTGSGKTALYLELARKALQEEKSVLLLAPEVAIALKLRQDAMNRNLPVTLYHGYQSPKQKEKTFKACAQHQQARLVVGTRSALFLPLSNLGLIILDEEHDDSFKQDEGLLYHAKDIAWYRAHQNNGLFLMGSATPDIKSYYASEQGLYPRYEMQERIGNASLPEITLADISKTSQTFAPETVLALKECIQKGEQAIIMLNRRGYAPVMFCTECKKTARCPHCDISLSYHKKREILSCHYCGYTRPVPSPCPDCGNLHGIPLGDGTERIEEYITELFRNSSEFPPKILRLDKDSTRKEGRMEEILNTFANKEAQILVGTQMLSKGHHFPDVTLAVIADADLGINFPDYRALERTFQLITQASGRAGRGEKKGRVIIQTRDRQNPFWQHILKGNYLTFYRQEIEQRKKRSYPPFAKLALVRCSFPKEKAKDGQAVWERFIKELKQKATAQGLRCTGSIPAPIALLQGRLRFQCFIRADSWNSIRSVYASCLPKQSMLQNCGMRISFDLDPVNML